MYGLYPELYLEICMLDGGLGVHGHGLRLDGAMRMHSQDSKLGGGSGVNSYRILLVLPIFQAPCSCLHEDLQHQLLPSHMYTLSSQASYERATERLEKHPRSRNGCVYLV